MQHITTVHFTKNRGLLTTIKLISCTCIIQISMSVVRAVMIVMMMLTVLTLLAVTDVFVHLVLLEMDLHVV